MEQKDQHPDHAKLDDKRNSNSRDTMLMLIRRELALILVGFIVIVASIAVMESGAMPILDKFLPAIMLILGFFFGQRSNQI